MSTTTELLNIIENTELLLQKTQVNLKKCPKTRLTKGYIDTRIKVIEECWGTYKRAYNELVKITPKEQRSVLPYFVNEDFLVFEDLYLVLLADLRDLLSELSKNKSPLAPVQNMSSSSGNSSLDQLVKLPRIELPTFSGNYEEWTAFQDLFTSLVHNNTTISDVQKLHYLKCSLTGEAKSLLKHIQVTQKNYEQAWNVLKTRYGNKRLIINSVLKKLFNQKKITSQSATHIKNLLDVTTECLNNLENLDISTDSWDPVVIFLVVQKLDSESHKDWEQNAYDEKCDILPTWSELKGFLQSKYRTLELVTSSSSPRYIPAVKERSFHIATTGTTTSSGKLCVLCKDNHTLCHCKEFTKLQPIERSEYVKKNNLCYNCLVSGHPAPQCRLSMFCRICKRRHHTLLHQKQYENASELSSSIQPKTSNHNVTEKEELNVNTVIASHYNTNNGTGTALLATATVTVTNDQNHTVILRALVDQGLQAAFINNKATQMLKLNKQSAKGSIIGVGSTRTNVDHMVQLQIGSRWDSSFKMNIQAYVMNNKLTTKIPSKAVTVNHWPHLEGLNLADPYYHTPGSIDLLLGVKEYAQIVQQSLIKGPPGSPCAQQTNLGWILFGEVNLNQQDESFLVLHHQVNIDNMMKCLWEIDTDYKRKLTKEEKLCETIYEQTHARTKEGRYVVRLPFKTEIPLSPEGNTKVIAENRLIHLEKRFKRTLSLKEEYKKVMKEYLALGHMEEIPESEINNKKYVYLPHHAVIRDNKETTKTRVVFDASAKGLNNVSLNDEMLVGPQLQDDLRNLIMRWRMKHVCYASDIQKMYRQILVHTDDADKYQRLLWRDDDSQEIKHYRMLRVTFGTASAPYLAVRTLQQVADDEGKDYPRASSIIKEDFYMDDLMSGADTTEEAITSAQQVARILEKGGFILSKWSSNCPKFMKSIGTSKITTQAHLDFKLDGMVKALGIIWNLGTDQFQYKLNLPATIKSITKRSILSDVQKLFDPLGWLAPSLIMAKILIQKIWLEKVDWDDRISEQLENEWKMIRKDLINVEKINIDRWYGTTSKNSDSIQIHGFSDASMLAYAAVVYIRSETQDGRVATQLIAARTRVAPLRTISLPRLELSGALLLSRLLKQVEQAMRIPKSQTYAWTDSSIVIAWLAGEPHKWKPFVANRVVEIVENVHTNRWHHVLSEDNPADIASRGMLLADLKESKLWWKGPTWLSKKEIKLEQEEVIQTDLERKTQKLQVNLKVQHYEEQKKSLTINFDQFENLKELIKVISYCKRFLNYNKEKEFTKRFTTEELERSLMTCIKLVQHEDYSNEIDRIRRKKAVKTDSKIKTLNPYLDENNILRVGGRLRHANLEETTKHPIILSNTNTIVALIVADAHTQTLHGGVQMMLCYLRSKYWILRAKALVKLCIHKCLVCARHRAVTRTQIMGDHQIMGESDTGSSFFKLRSRFCRSKYSEWTGPFRILRSRGRGVKTQKAYISVFVCMSTKAIHLELVGDLTSEAFIAAFKRFVSRRGRCNNIWSDQGRNFIGADKELAAAWREANLVFDGDISHSLALEGTQWHHIPAYSPNFGGLWEAGVKSVKHHLKRVLTANLTFEEMTTVLCQIEACLNSRPLCPIDDNDTDGIEPLTPGHFLIGEAPITVPSPDFKDVKVTSLSRWQYTRKLLGDFWRRWQQEYLSRLQQRPIWLKKVEEFKVGDIVLIKTDGLPPGKWSYGRIVDKHAGEDGHTRVYSVKSSGNIVKRPVTKLCAMPIDID